MKKIYNLLILCTLAIVCGNVLAQNFDFAGGNGDKASPYLISEQKHLVSLAEMVNTFPGCSRGKYFKT